MSITLISIILGVILLIGLVIASYVKAPPSVAFLISGILSFSDEITPMPNPPITAIITENAAANHQNLKISL